MEICVFHFSQEKGITFIEPGRWTFRCGEPVRVRTASRREFLDASHLFLSQSHNLKIKILQVCHIFIWQKNPSPFLLVSAATSTVLADGSCCYCRHYRQQSAVIIVAAITTVIVSLLLLPLLLIVLPREEWKKKYLCFKFSHTY